MTQELRARNRDMFVDREPDPFLGRFSQTSQMTMKSTAMDDNVEPHEKGSTNARLPVIKKV